MLAGLGRFSAVVWGLVTVWVFWLLSGVFFNGPVVLAADLVKAWLVIALAMGLCYVLHRATCWGCSAVQPAPPPRSPCITK